MAHKDQKYAKALRSVIVTRGDVRVRRLGFSTFARGQGILAVNGQGTSHIPDWCQGLPLGTHVQSYKEIIICACLKELFN